MKRYLRGMTMIVLGLIVLSLSLLGCAPNDAALEEQDTFPTGPITIYVGFDPGGGQDITCRALAPHMSRFLGQEVVVVNMPGASGAVAAEFVHKQPADGYTLYSNSSSAGAWATQAQTDLHYDHFLLLHINVSPTPVITVPADSPFEDLNDLIAALKAGGTTGSNSGIGGAWHVPQAAFVNAVGGSVTYVPYDGGAPAALAVAKGEVDWGVHAETEGLQFFKDGLSRPLAVFAPQPLTLEGYGEIPSVLDYVPDFKDTLAAVGAFRALSVRQGTPDHIVQRLAEASQYAVRTQEFKDWAASFNLAILDIKGETAQHMYEQAFKHRSWLLYDIGEGERSPDEVGVPRP